jgi:hypothetical protein
MSITLRPCPLDKLSTDHACGVPVFGGYLGGYKTMPILETILSWAAIAAGFISAGLWYRASGAVVLKGDPRSSGGFFTGTKDGTQVDVYSTVVEGSRLNKHAAIATAVAILLQALAVVMGKLG